VGTIVTLTMNPALDVSTDVDRVVPGEKLRCGPTVIDPGGGGVNVSRVVHRLGGVTEAVYLAGGVLGDSYTELVRSEGFRTHRVEVSGATRESFTVTESATGKQFRFVLTGPTLSSEDADRALVAVSELLEPGDWLVASGSLPPGIPVDFYGTVAESLSSRGVRVVIDAAEPWLGPVMGRGVHLLKPSLHEMEEILGRSLPDRADQVQGASELRQRTGAWAVALSLGARGALLHTPEGTWHAVAPRVDAVSTVGAGDSFLGGLLASLQRGESPDQALAWGVAAGTATAMSPGTHLCDTAEVERLKMLVTTTTLDE
jgi:6-phosphofructokinase 2